MEHRRNCVNNPTLDQSGIIDETKIKSTENLCSDTGDENKWIRNCPKCNRIIICSSKKYRNISNKLSSLCYSCAFTGRFRSEEYRLKISKVLTGKKLSVEHKERIKNACQNVSDESRKKMSLAGQGKPSHRKGKILSKEWKREIRNTLLNLPKEIKQKIIIGNKTRILSGETRRKMRLARIKYIEKIRFHGGKMTPRFSIKACQYFDNLNKQNGWKLQHALNGGEVYLKELGYWLDGYDTEKIL